MIPATAVVRFTNNASDTIISPAFTEFLWEQESSGRVNCHVEIDTEEYAPGGVVVAQAGTFVKGNAAGAFSIDFGTTLTATASQFWWPQTAVSQQPPLQTGQGRWGLFSRWDGLAANADTAGYSLLSPRTINQSVVFNLLGVGKPTKTLAAQHFINSGPLRFYFEFSYMSDPPS
jgi:hypothetical protein